MTTAAPAKFFVNQGVVSSRTDMQNLLRPTLKQTVSYRFMRGRDLIAHGTGWVERIVADEADTSTYFTPISITLNIDSFEHLEFETRPDQLLVYTLVQGDERVIIEYAPMTSADAEAARRPRRPPARVRHERLRPDGAPGPRRPRRGLTDAGLAPTTVRFLGKRPGRSTRVRDRSHDVDRPSANCWIGPPADVATEPLRQILAR